MKSVFSKIVAILFVFSIVANILFIVGKGIVIHNKYNQQQYQNQQQTQISIGLHISNSKISWKTYSIEDIKKMGIKNKWTYHIGFREFLNTLPAEQAIFSKFDNHILYVPVFNK